MTEVLVDPVADWLRGFRAPYYHHLTSQMYGVVDGWTGASDGHVLVLLSRVVPGIEGEPFTGMVKTMREFMALEANGVTVSLQELRQWMKGGEVLPKCSACDGSGYQGDCDRCDGAGDIGCVCQECDDEHEYECRSCKGIGKIACDADGCGGPPKSADKVRRYGTVLGVAVNRDVLAAGMGDLLPGDTARVQVSPIKRLDGGEDQGHLALYGDGWRVLVMGVRHNESVEGVLPAFKATA